MGVANDVVHFIERIATAAFYKLYCSYSLLFACLRASCAAAPDITKLSSSLWQSYLNRILRLGTFVL